MHTIKHKQQGNALLKAIVFIPGAIILLTLAYFGFCEARKAYWDHQVRLMFRDILTLRFLMKVASDATAGSVIRYFQNSACVAMECR